MRDRRAELLKILAFLGSSGLRRQERRDLGQVVKPCLRESGFTENRLAVFTQEEDGRDLASLISRLPVPGAGGVGSAEGSFHGSAEGDRIDSSSLFEMRKQEIGGSKGRRCSGERRGRIGHGGNHVHG